MRRLFTAIPLLALAAASTQAAGGLWCSAEDAILALTVQSGVTHGLGGPFFDFQASAEIKALAVSPELRTLKLSDALVHHWIDGEDVKLSFYREQEKGEFVIWVNIVIDANQVPDSDGEYEGTYVLTHSSGKGDNDLLALTGRIGCGMD